MRGIIYQSGDMATEIDNIGSACFNACIEVNSQNMYEPCATQRGKRISDIYGFIKV